VSGNLLAQRPLGATLPPHRLRPCKKLRCARPQPMLNSLLAVPQNLGILPCSSFHSKCVFCCLSGFRTTSFQPILTGISSFIFDLSLKITLVVGLVALARTKPGGQRHRLLHAGPGPELPRGPARASPHLMDPAGVARLRRQSGIKGTRIAKTAPYDASAAIVSVASLPAVLRSECGQRVATSGHIFGLTTSVCPNNLRGQ
jgi:hypothetical protein